METRFSNTLTAAQKQAFIINFQRVGEIIESEANWIKCRVGITTHGYVNYDTDPDEQVVIDNLPIEYVLGYKGNHRFFNTNNVVLDFGAIADFISHPALDDHQHPENAADNFIDAVHDAFVLRDFEIKELIDVSKIKLTI